MKQHKIDHIDDTVNLQKTFYCKVMFSFGKELLKHTMNGHCNQLSMFLKCQQTLIIMQSIFFCH